MENLRIYEASRSVPKEAQKSFNNGSFSGTDINPMWRIKKLTELFGPVGCGWYYEVVSERAEEHHDVTMAIVDLNLYVKIDGDWSKPIYGTGGNMLVKSTSKGPKPSDEGYKMALTDALSVACKALGIGADIYFEKDKTKYTEESADAAKKASAEPPEHDKLDELMDTLNAAGVQGKIICQHCGHELQPYTNSKGTVSVEKHVAACKKKLGEIVCIDCIKREERQRA